MALQSKVVFPNTPPSPKMLVKHSITKCFDTSLKMLGAIVEHVIVATFSPTQSSPRASASGGLCPSSTAESIESRASCTSWLANATHMQGTVGLFVYKSPKNIISIGNQPSRMLTKCEFGQHSSHKV